MGPGAPELTMDRPTQEGLAFPRSHSAEGHLCPSQKNWGHDLCAHDPCAHLQPLLGLPCSEREPPSEGPITPTNPTPPPGTHQVTS